MRILLFHQYFLEKDDPGGARFNEMANVWCDEGHEITVICGMLNYVTGKVPTKYKGRKFQKSKYREKLEVIRCFVSKQYNTNFLGRLWAYLSFVLSSLWAGIFLAKDKYNVIVISSPPLFIGISGFLVSFVKRIPYVFEVRDLWPESAVDTGVINNKFIIQLAFRLEAFLYKNASLINVLTPAFKRHLMEQKGIKREKIILIPNAADFTLAETMGESLDYEEIRNRFDLNGKFVVTYIGAHGVANNLIQLVNVAKLLQDLPIQFLLIGDGMMKKMLINEAEKHGLSNITFMTPVPKAEVYKYIMASDLGVSVLKDVDTFKTVYSNKTFDYMACKKPILMAIDGVSRELIQSANCGVFVRPEDTLDMEEKIRSLYQDRENLPRLGLNGYKYAKEFFDRRKLSKEYLKHLSGIENL